MVVCDSRRGPPGPGPFLGGGLTSTLGGGGTVIYPGLLTWGGLLCEIYKEWVSLGASAFLYRYFVALLFEGQPFRGEIRYGYTFPPLGRAWI